LVARLSDGPPFLIRIAGLPLLSSLLVRRPVCLCAAAADLQDICHVGRPRCMVPRPLAELSGIGQLLSALPRPAPPVPVALRLTEVAQTRLDVTFAPGRPDRIGRCRN